MWGTILTIGLKLLGIILDQLKAKKETKEAYLKFVLAVQTKQNVSIKLRKDYQAQLEELRKNESV